MKLQLCRKGSKIFSANGGGFAIVPQPQTPISALTILRHFANPMLWDSFIF